jgi:hypothetical protein
MARENPRWGVVRLTTLNAQIRLRWRDWLSLRMAWPGVPKCARASAVWNHSASRYRTARREYTLGGEVSDGSISSRGGSHGQGYLCASSR